MILKFYASGAPQFVIPSIDCSVLIYGCNDGYEVEEHEGSCDICVEKGLSTAALFVIILVLISCGLFTLLVIIISAIIGKKYW